MPSGRHARLVLEDGSIFYGKLLGKQKPISGEVVFNTGMMGYPESLTDPSYKGQILTFTYPLMGNYGVPEHKIENGLSDKLESYKVHVQAAIVSEHCERHSHWDAAKSLSEWLEEEGVPLLTGIDTRALTQHLRDKGVMLGKIIVDEDIDFYNPNEENLVAQVSPDKVYEYGEGDVTIVAVDCGMKHNIVRSFLKRNVKIIRVPWDYDFHQLEFDGLFISNGPGDPSYVQVTVDNIKKALDKDVPTFGICLGNQLLGLAAGAETFKLKYGHRSQNQPCIEKGTDRCIITSQNHGYALDPDNLPEDWEEWFVNANDGTNEGIRHRVKPFFSCQFHPEANPGPKDADYLFDEFVEVLRDK